MRVLIAEDDAISQRVLQATLTKWGYDVVVTSDGREALETLSAPDAPRLAVLDWMMPELDGTEVCSRIRRIEGGEYYYLILLTARGQKEDIVTGLEAGADDYVIKPFDSRELRVRIRCGRRIIELQNELLATRDELAIQATHDSLTGLLNRTALFDVLEKEHNRSLRNRKPMAVVMVDLDHFKTVNDTYGHLAGDRVIKEATRRMCSDARRYDTIGRYGGEEFLVLLPEAPLDAAAREADRLRNIIAETPFDIGDRSLPVTASMGVSGAGNVDGLTVNDLVFCADEALYDAKESGRNQVKVRPAEPQPQSSTPSSPGETFARP